MDFYTLTYLYTAGFMDLWFEGNIKELWLNFSKEVFYSFDVSYSYRWVIIGRNIHKDYSLLQITLVLRCAKMY